MSIIKVQSTKELTFNARRNTNGIVTREIDIIQINVIDDTISARITEKCYDKDGNLIDKETPFFTHAMPAKELLEAAVYPVTKQQLIGSTIADAIFGAQAGDFEVVEEEITEPDGTKVSTE